MNAPIEELKKNIHHIKDQIINHPLYSVIEDVDDLKVFMKYHVYAVWDFMSLLKSLQNQLTCTSVPWFPKGSADTRFLINEIVTGEESDVDMNGVRKSHFELYLDAMHQVGADTTSIMSFLDTLKHTSDLQSSFKFSGTPRAAQDFVSFTFDVINSGKDYTQSAIFTFGREDLIPGMFISLVDDINKNLPERVSVFKYYLERHIEVDGDHHSHLALQMTSYLCGNDDQKWKEAERATVGCLQHRISLWDAALEEIKSKKSESIVN